MKLLKLGHKELLSSVEILENRYMKRRQNLLTIELRYQVDDVCKLSA